MRIHPEKQQRKGEAVSRGIISMAVLDLGTERNLGRPREFKTGNKLDSRLKR